MDAPWHFHSTTDSGARPAPSIDEAPLDLFFRAGVKLDFSKEQVELYAGTKRSEEHTSELHSLMRISYAVFCLKKKNNKTNIKRTNSNIINLTISTVTTH